MYIKVFKRKHALSSCWEGPYKLLTTYTAIKIKEKSSWIHASAASFDPDQQHSQDNWKTIPKVTLNSGFPGPRSRQNHEVDSFSQDHRSRSLTFTYLPFPTFKTPYTHTLKRKNKKTPLFLINKSFLCIY